MPPKSKLKQRRVVMQKTKQIMYDSFRKEKDTKKLRRMTNYAIWVPFYLAFGVMFAAILIGWFLHHKAVSTGKEIKAPANIGIRGRSGGDPFTPIWGKTSLIKKIDVPKVSWGKENQTIILAQGDKSIPVENFSVSSETKVYTYEEELPAWKKNAVSVEFQLPMIAIVIDDLGLNRKMTKEVIHLPAPLTTSFLAYADDLEKQTAIAAKAGHELLVHVPMEPLNNNPGPGALLLGMSSEEIRERLDFMLSSFPGYVGINNHMGSKFTADRKSMEVVLDEIDKKGLLFLDSLTSKDSAAKKVAQEKKMPYAVRNVFLDNAKEAKKVRKQLALLEKIARRNGVAVGIGHPHKSTVEALQQWIPEARAKGFSIVPISAVVGYLQEEQKEEKRIYEAVNHEEE